jgi:hypothetical protein
VIKDEKLEGLGREIWRLIKRGVGAQALKVSVAELLDEK